MEFSPSNCPLTPAAGWSCLARSGDLQSAERSLLVSSQISGDRGKAKAAGISVIVRRRVSISGSPNRPPLA